MLIYHVAYALQQQQPYAQCLAHQDVQYVIVIHAYAAQDVVHSHVFAAQDVFVSHVYAANSAFASLANAALFVMFLPVLVV